MANVVKPKLFDTSSSYEINVYNYNENTIDPFKGVTQVDYNALYEQDVIRKNHNTKKKFSKVMANLAKRTFASTTNAGVSLLKGLTSFVEGLTDAVVMAGCAVATAATATSDVVDLVASKINGEKWEGFSNTKALWADGVMPMVGENMTQDAFDMMYYDTKFGKFVEDNAFEPFKQNGAACKITEGIGYYTGVVALATVTAGAGTVAGLSSEAVAHGAIAATAAMGRNAQSGYNRLSDEEKKDGGELAKVLAASAGEAVIEGAAYTIGVEAGGMAQQAAFNNVKNQALQEIGKRAVSGAVQGTIKSTRPIINEGIDSLTYGTEYDFKKVGTQVVATYAAEAVGAGVQSAVAHHAAPSTASQAAATASQFQGAPNASNLPNDIIQSVDPLEIHLSYATSEWAEGVTSNTIEGAVLTTSENIVKAATEEVVNEASKEVSNNIMQDSAAMVAPIAKEATKRGIQSILDAA